MQPTFFGYYTLFTHAAIAVFFVLINPRILKGRVAYIITSKTTHKTFVTMCLNKPLQPKVLLFIVGHFTDPRQQIRRPYF